MTRLFRFLPLLMFCLGVSPVLMVLPALAAAAAAAGEPATSFWSALPLWLNSTAGILGMAIGLLLFREWLKKWTESRGLQDDKVVRDYLYPTLDIVVRAAFARLGFAGVLATLGDGADRDAVSLRREAEMEAVHYLTDKVPGGLERFGLGAGGAREMVAVRLNAMAGEAVKNGAATAGG